MTDTETSPRKRSEPSDEVPIVWDAADVFESFNAFDSSRLHARTTILDPWYNKGIGGTRPDYFDFIDTLLARSAKVSDHVFLWGFPEIVAHIVPRVPSTLTLVAWLTWYYKNSPSVIRGWRSSQMACLHLSRPGARLFPQHFLNEAQLDRLRNGKLRYMPGPTSVIDYPLLCGFVGKNEQLGHPSQKPVAVIEPLIRMTSEPGDLIFDPMCGAGTTGEAARRLGRKSILCDAEQTYVEMSRARFRAAPNDQPFAEPGSLFEP